MKSLPIAFVMLLSMGLAANTAWSDVTLTNDFTNANLVFQAATTAVETYAFTTVSSSEAQQDVSVTRPLLRTGPSIVASGPLGQAWVFSTGSSNQIPGCSLGPLC